LALGAGRSSGQAALLVLLPRPTGARIVAADLGAGANERSDGPMVVVMMAVVVMATAASVIMNVVVMGLRCVAGVLRLGAHRLRPSLLGIPAI